MAKWVYFIPFYDGKKLHKAGPDNPVVIEHPDNVQPSRFHLGLNLVQPYVPGGELETPVFALPTPVLDAKRPMPGEAAPKAEEEPMTLSGVQTRKVTRASDKDVLGAR